MFAILSFKAIGTNDLAVYPSAVWAGKE